MAASTHFEGFSISHAAILDGTTGAESATVYGVRNGTLSTDNGNFENTGDDVVLSEWLWINFANITIEAGFISFETLALITGTTLSSSGSGTDDYYGLPLWALGSMNQVRRPLALRVPAKNDLGDVYTLDFVLYNVAFQPFNFTGPSYKNGLTISMAGRALFSTVNETGTTLASGDKEIGRIVASPGNQTGAFTALPFPTT